MLTPEPAALFRLMTRPRDRFPWEFYTGVVQELRESAEESRKLTQEDHSSMVSEHTSRTLFALTEVTALALPINIASSLFGMDMGRISLQISRFLSGGFRPIKLSRYAQPAKPSSNQD
ncbi:hypothetical protein TDB9533_00500 [Thalassocella blandensis]|nr:hypothetical protein TDB9533_00500 [Thalassocella blandensis]